MVKKSNDFNDETKTTSLNKLSNKSQNDNNNYDALKEAVKPSG